MTPQEIVQLTEKMKVLGVECFEAGDVKVRFSQAISYPDFAKPVVPLTEEDKAKFQSELNERLMFGSSM
jgi:ClpP class serine protease